MPDSGPLSRPKTVLELILEWSLDRPAWQRDALRRIVQAQKLTDADIVELVALCKRGRMQNPPPAAWTDAGQAQPQPHPVLSAISIFDASCAAVHLRTRNEVAFRPFGLDVPDELADACKRVKAALDAEKQQLEAARNAIFANPPWKPSTAVGTAVVALTHATYAASLETIAAHT